jgi:uncharacterized protein involved in exopolysaccharide biosynthesis
VEITEVWEWGPFLKRRKWSIALITALTIAVTAAISFVIPSSYASTATLVVQPLTMDQPLSNSSALELNARNIGELLKSPSVEQRAAGSLKQARIKGEPQYRVLEGSGLVQVTVTGASPQAAANEANAIATAFMDLYTESLRAGAEKAQSGLEDQLKRLRARIAATEVELAAARTGPGGAPAVSELQDRLDALNTAYEGVLQEAQLVPASETELSTAVLLGDKAVPEPEPVSPKPLLNLLLATVGGLLLGIAFARATEPPPKGPETGH